MFTFVRIQDKENPDELIIPVQMGTKKKMQAQAKWQRYFLELAYNGGAYHGWQIQQNARTVQEVLEHALSTVCRTPISSVGCGRTDTGVHAKQLFAHVDLPQRVNDPDLLIHRVNALLPSDIALKALLPVHPDAHARFDAIQRSYEYHAHVGKNPFLQGFSWQLREIPDLDAMNAAASILHEYTDFSCFSKSNTQVFTNNCRIDEAYWTQMSEDACRVVFHISADRFLRNMVRAIVGTLLEIGQGRHPISHIRQVIESRDRSNAGMSVPAEGLYLTAVRYPEAYFDQKSP